MTENRLAVAALSSFLSQAPLKYDWEKVDWENFEAVAIRHKIVPVLFHFIIKRHQGKFPSGIEEKFKSHHTINARESLSAAARLVRIIGLLKSKNIQAIPFKGIVFAKQVYGDIALRHLGDTDLLISPQDAFRAVHLLKPLGYEPAFKVNETLFSKYLASRGGIELLSAMGQGTVDLHWELTNRYSIIPYDHSMVFPNMKTMDLMNTEFSVLSNEDVLLVLCFHGAKDQWQSLERIFSLAFLIKNNPEMDWERIMDTAKRLHGGTVILFGLFLTRTLMGVELPDRVMREIDGVEEKLKRMFALVTSNKGGLNEHDTTRFSWAHFQIRDCWQDRLKYLFHLIMRPSSVEWNHFPLPAFLTFFYTLIRPVRLAATFLKRRFRR